MTRVTDFAKSQYMLAQFQQLQERAFQAERQVATGKKAEYFKDISKDASLLLSAKGLESRVLQYQDTAQFLLGRYELQNVQLEDLAKSATDLKLESLNAVALQSGTGYMAFVEQVFETAVGIMNTKVDGKYIYGGTRTDVPPVNIDTLADLIAAPSVAAIFENTNLKQSVKVDDNVTMEHGFLASDIATDLFDVIKRIAEYDANVVTGPFTGTLTDAQSTFIQAEMTNFNQIIQNLNEAVAQNGRRHSQVQQLAERHNSMRTYVEGFISDIEDVDMAEAITRLNQTQVATEASLRMLSSLQRMSLLDFI